MDWIVNNFGSIVTVATAIVTGASAICAITPTPTDDAVIKKIYNILELLAINIGKAKD